LSNESQNITKKRYAILYDISIFIYYLIVVFLKYLQKLGYQAFAYCQKEKADIPIKVYLLLLLDKVTINFYIQFN